MILTLRELATLSAMGATVYLATWYAVGMLLR